MRHLKKGRELGRVSSQRTALFRTMIGSLVMRERIRTTEAKAKEIKGRVDRVISKAKRGAVPERKVAAIRDLRKYVPMMAVEKLMNGEFIVRFAKRESGYTRIIKLPARKSDGARMAVIEFVD